MKKVLGN
jgi:nicotinamide riboside transporter PnuC